MSLKDERLVLTNDGVFLTVQGEGLFTGHPSVFIRLSGCNLRCAWTDTHGREVRCDTPYSSFRPERNVLSVDSIVQSVREVLQKQTAPVQGMHAVITGGEPTLQESMVTLANLLCASGMKVTVETNGTREAPFLSPSVFLSVSPKLIGSGNVPKDDYAMTVAKLIGVRAAQLKFVISSLADAHDALSFGQKVRDAIKELGIGASIMEMWMPMGDDEGSILECSEWLIPLCISHNIRFCDRMHIRQWGKRRGV